MTATTLTVTTLKEYTECIEYTEYTECIEYTEYTE